MKKLVSMFTPRITPRRPSFTIHQSWPGVRRRRVSQPSIHLPLLVNLSAMKMALPSLSRLDLPAKNSSLAAMALPPTRADARSILRVNSSIPGDEDVSDWLRGKIPSVIDFLSSDESSLHDPFQLASGVGGQLVAVLDGLGLDGEFGFR